MPISGVSIATWISMVSSCRTKRSSIPWTARCATTTRVRSSAAGPHGKWAKDPTSPAAACTNCHGTHDVLSSSEPESPLHPSRVDEICARCHPNVPRDISRSPHGTVDNGRPNANCVDCHSGHRWWRPSNSGPDRGLWPATPEEAAQNRASLHGRAAVRGDPAAPNCIICHDHHAILPHTDPKSPTNVVNVPLLCGRCHREGTEVSLQHDIPQDRILENFSMSVHGEALFKKGLSGDRGVHLVPHLARHPRPHQSRSSINRENVARTCMHCHSRIEEVHVKVVEGRLWEEKPHKVPSCVECHQPHKIRRGPVSPQEASSQRCLECHTNPELEMRKNGETVSLFIDEKAYGLSLARGSRLRPVPHRGDPQPSGAGVRDDHFAGRLRHLPRASGPGARHQPPRTTGGGRRPGRADLPRLSRQRHATEGYRLPTAPTYPRNVPVLCGDLPPAGKVAADPPRR